MAQINVALDIGASIAHAKQLVAALQDQSKAVIQLADQSAKLNTINNQARITLKGLDAEGRKYVQVLKQTADGIKVVSLTVSGLTNEQKKLIEEQKKAKKAAEDLEKAQIKGARNAEREQERVRKSIEKEIELRKKAAQEARALMERNAAGMAAQGMARGAFPLPSNATTAQAIAYEQSLIKIREAFLKGKISAEEFNKIIAGLSGNPKKALNGLSPAAQKVAQDVRRLAQVSNQTATEVQKAGEKMSISFAGIVRLFESQIVREGIQAFINNVKESISTAAEFSIRIAEIRTISQDANITQEQWANTVSRLATEYGKSQLDVAAGAYETLSNQVARGTQVIDFMESSLKFSLATVSSTADSVNLLSSAIKSFNLPASEADRVAASLFKTIDLGRVRAQEMANTYGRVGLIARSVGVDMDSLNAALATLTVQGVKFSDASTFMSNLMLKLLQPTEAMKNLFTQWGVTSGQAAIATYGLRGVLELLDKEAKKGASEFEDLFGQIRALRGAIGLTGSAFQDFDSNLKKIQDSTEQYNKAIDIVKKSTGQEFKEEMNAAKIYFEQEFGRAFIKTANDWIKTFGGMQNILENVVPWIMRAIKVQIAFTATTKLAAGIQAVQTLATELYTAAKIKATIATTANTGATTANTGAMTSNTAATGAATARLGLYALAAYGAIEALKLSLGEAQAFDDAMDEAESKLDKRDAAIKKTGAYKNRIENEQNISKALDIEIERRFAKILKTNADIVANASKVKDKQIEYWKLVTETVKNLTAGFMDSLNQQLNRINEKIRQARDNIVESKKLVGEQPGKFNETIFRTKMQYANEQQQLQMLTERMEMLRTRARELSAQIQTDAKAGKSDPFIDKQRMDEIRGIYDQLEQMESERFGKEVERDKKRGGGRTVFVAPGVDEFGEARLDFVVRTADYEERIRDIAQERITLERQFQKDQLTAQQKIEEERKREVQRVDQIKKLLEAIGKFSVIDEKTGKVKDEFRGVGKSATPQEAAARAQAEFGGLVDKLKEVAGEEEFKKNLGLFAELEKQKQAIVQQTTAVILEEEAKRNQQLGINAKTNAQNAKKAAIDARTQARKTIEQNRREIEKMMAAIEKTATADPRTTIDSSAHVTNFPWAIDTARRAMEGKSPRTPIGVFKEAREEEDRMAAANDARKAAIEAAKAAQVMGAELVRDQTPEAAQRFYDAVQKAKQAYIEFAEIRTGRTADQITLPGEKDKTQSLRQRLIDMETQAYAIKGQVDNAAIATQNLNQAFSDLDAGVGVEFEELNQNFIDLGEASDFTTLRIQTGFDNVGSTIRSLQVEADILNMKFQQMRLPSGDVQERRWGGMIKYFNSGGFVPRGSDTIPAMLSPGEFVMNRRAAAKWYPQLMAMNANKPAQYFNQGGPVTVGDINITVPGGNTPAQTIRDIAQGLRRGLKRGTIRLD